MDYQNNVEFAYDSIDEAFPICDPQFRPTGNRVLIQLRTPKKKTKGGIILTTDVRETEVYNTQVGKVLAIGSLAFMDRDKFVPWPEGPWFKIGDFVRVPRYGGDRWCVPTGAEDGEEAILCLFKETEIGGLFTGDPTAIKAFI